MNLGLCHLPGFPFEGTRIAIISGTRSQMDSCGLENSQPESISFTVITVIWCSHHQYILTVVNTVGRTYAETLLLSPMAISLVQTNSEICRKNGCRWQTGMVISNVIGRK